MFSSHIWLECQLIRFQKDGRNLSVDTGFIVYNEVNYPNLKKFFEEVNVKTESSDMSFALSSNEGSSPSSPSSSPSSPSSSSVLIFTFLFCALLQELKKMKESWNGDQMV